MRTLGKKAVGMNSIIVSRWCWCNAGCSCKNTSGLSALYNTEALLGDYSTA